MEEIIEIISKIIKQKITLDDIHRPILNFENWDSLAHLIIISELERLSHISIPMEDFDQIVTISDFSKYLI